MIERVIIELQVETMNRIRAIAIRENRPLVKVLQLAVEQCAAQGYTDVIVTKGKI